MAYFKDPYKKYYDTLSGESNLATDLGSIISNISNCNTSLDTVSGSITSSNWSESGVMELVNNVIPTLVNNHKIIEENINNSLKPIILDSFNKLLPLLAKLKVEDEYYDNLVEAYNSLDSSSDYDDERNKLSGRIEESKKKCENYVKECDSTIKKIKSYDSNVEEIEEVTFNVEETTELVGTDISIEGLVSNGKMIKVRYGNEDVYLVNTKINVLDYSKYLQENGLTQNAGLLGGECMLLSQYYAVDLLRGTYTDWATMDSRQGSPATRINGSISSPNREDILKYIYGEATEGRPSVLQVTQQRTKIDGSRHLVTVVGFAAGVKSIADLNPNTIYVIDCVDGRLQTLAERNRDLFPGGGNYFARAATQEFLEKEVYV